ncbi:hypothetical protein [uncultured Clostridium sp.]|nr:hypothetical protein [uncultured Clostridium sp.]
MKRLKCYPRSGRGAATFLSREIPVNFIVKQCRDKLAGNQYRY